MKVRLKTWRHWAAWLLLTPLLLACGTVSPDAYDLKLWSVEDRLPGSPLVGVSQARDGYLWLVTHTQLIRFNGVSFREIPLAATMLEQIGELQGVFCGQADAVWVHGAQGLACYRADGWQVWALDKLRDDDQTALFGAGEILGLLATSDGGMVAFAERGLLEALTDATQQVVRFRLQLSPVPPDDRATLGAVTDAVADSTGRIWLTAWNGLLEYHDGQFDDKSMRLPDFLVEAADGVHAGASGRLWIHGPSGVAYREGDIWTPIGFPENAGMVAALLESSDRALWLGNPTGLFRWHQERWQRIGEPDAPGSLAVNDLIEDQDGTLWAACDGGLLRIRKKVIGRLDVDGLALTGTAYALTPQPDQSVWVGYRGRALRLTAAEGRLLQTIYLDTDVPVSAILQDKEQTVWLGTLGGGLFMMTPTSLRLVTQSDYSLPAIHTVYALFEDPIHGVLVGTPQGLMRVVADGGLESAELYGVEITEPVHSLYRDVDGTLWVCCERLGLVRVTADGSQQMIGSAEGLQGYPRVIMRDSRSNLWVGTTTGLFLVQPGRVLAMSEATGGFEEAVLQIAEDRQQRLWLGTTGGLLCLELEDLWRTVESWVEGTLVTVRMLHFGSSSGVPGARAVSGAAAFNTTLENTLWLPFAQGIAAVKTDQIKLARRVPEVVIEKVMMNGEAVFDSLKPFKRRLSLPPGSGNLVFEFAALAPGEVDSVRYRYRLEGLSGGWSAVQAEHSALFEWLPAGDYRLHVIAEAGGVWNHRGVVLPFSVRAFFWQTTWFYLSLAVLIAVVFFLIARGIAWHRYRMQMTLLKREEELSLERARISRDIHDELGNGLSVVATLSELAHNDVNTPNIHKRLDQIYEVANELARNVDETVWAVNPENDGWEPFVSYFEQYTEYFLGSSGLRFHFTRPSELIETPVASKTRHHLLLAVREAVSNVLKHAAAQQVKIIMTLEGDFLIVRVEDDGVGFDVSEQVGVGHDGLKNLQRRMREINGELKITSTPNVGTCVEFRVPFLQPMGHS